MGGVEGGVSGMEGGVEWGTMDEEVEGLARTRVLLF